MQIKNWMSDQKSVALRLATQETGNEFIFSETLQIHFLWANLYIFFYYPRIYSPFAGFEYDIKLTGVATASTASAEVELNHASARAIWPNDDVPTTEGIHRRHITGFFLFQRIPIGTSMFIVVDYGQPSSVCHVHT